jgi:hypothetical protein
MNQHLAIEFVAGDDWEILATLLDENGDPYDLATGPPEILWTLVDRTWKPVIEADEIGISIVDAAAGQCAIQIPAAVTTTVEAAVYSDFIRIVIGGVTSTLATGPIFVTADPWRVAAPVMATQSTTPVSTVRQLKPRGRAA